MSHEVTMQSLNLADAGIVEVAGQQPVQPPLLQPRGTRQIRHGLPAFTGQPKLHYSSVVCQAR